jgi:hypothetical protein
MPLDLPVGIWRLAEFLQDSLSFILLDEKDAEIFNHRTPFAYRAGLLG